METKEITKIIKEDMDEGATHVYMEMGTIFLFDNIYNIEIE